MRIRGKKVFGHPCEPIWCLVYKISVTEKNEKLNYP